MEEAKRNPINTRYDILYPNFEEGLAKIAKLGADKYGDFNWCKSRLTGDKSPLNHMQKHLISYKRKDVYDHKDVMGSDYKNHLLAIAFNAMMEYFYCENFPDANSPSPKSPESF